VIPAPYRFANSSVAPQGDVAAVEGQMSDIQPTRQGLENLWQKRVADAKVRLDLASNYLREVQRILKSRIIPSTDGHYAYHHAQRAEILALTHYQSVLNTLSTLVLTGKTPRDPRQIPDRG
jgi:hypothetical protein